jgi:hypothetical protein
MTCKTAGAGSSGGKSTRGKGEPDLAGSSKRREGVGKGAMMKIYESKIRLGRRE